MLQLRDLDGDIVGTVGDSESETKLLSTYNSTEFGVPNEGTTPPKYAWLGAEGVSSEPSQGAGTSTQSGASYVPRLRSTYRPRRSFPRAPFQMDSLAHSTLRRCRRSNSNLRKKKRHGFRSARNLNDKNRRKKKLRKNYRNAAKRAAAEQKSVRPRQLKAEKKNSISM